MRLLVRLFTVQTSPDPDTESQPVQPPNVPLGVAVNVTVVPFVKLPLQVVAQLRPKGELVMIPEPVPTKSTVRVGPEGQTTIAVINPVTIAPDECRPPALVFVVTVAETRAPPQAKPVAARSPVELTVTISGVFEAQVTWSVMSLVTGGWM